MTPQDFYTIYDVNKVFTGGNVGAGASVAVVEQSDMKYGTVNSSTGAATGGDVATFRSLFGVGGTLNMKVMHGAGTVTCNAPGIVNGDEGEATLDAEWANALAPSAQLIYMACDNVVNNGVISSLMALIDNNIGNVLSMSYGSSESTAVASDYTLQDTLFQQAAAQGQTVIVSAGDSGSDTNDQNTNGTATSGLNVDIFAASPLVLGAGGTDFSDLYDALEGGPAQTAYWATANTSKYGDALGYIPETPWNDSCASSLLARYFGYTGAGFCGAGTSSGYVLGDVVAGGGGFSTHYAQPSWQTGTLGVTGTKRAVPDISMFAANGVWGHALVFCDSSSSTSACTSTSTFGLAGGTSFVAPALAGVTGLLVTATHEGQGVLNPALYALARAQFSGPTTATACYSNGQTSSTGVTTSLPAAACIFHDITTSNNDVPCASATLNCFVNSGQTYGVLSTTGSSSLTVGYASGVGYDEATGLGSVDVYNLVTKWNQAYTSSTTLIAAASSIPATGSDQLTATVAGGLPTGSGSGAPALVGTVSFAAGSTALGTCTLSGNSCSITVQGSALASGANSITATYAGNGTYPASTSAPVTVTVTGTASSLVVSPTSLSFGSQADLKPSAAQSVTVSNPSSAAITLGGISFTGSNATDFSQTTTCSSTVAAGASCSISVKFTPAAPGTRTATLNVANSGSTQTVGLTGTGVGSPVSAVITPGTGTYSSPQQVTMSDATPGAVVYYAINGGTNIKYTAPLTVSTNETITATGVLFAGNSYTQSASVTATYTFSQTQAPAVPVISPGAGGYTSVQTVTITDTTSGANIFYAINGGAYVPYTAPFSLSASESISAYASVTVSGTTTSSAVVTQNYVVVLPPAVPVISPGAGGYTSAQTVTITDATSGASIFYAINGGTYVPYTAPFSLSASESISAYATLTSSGTTATSATVTQAYVVVLPPAVPVISPGAGGYTSVQTVKITDATSGASIFYAINGGAYVPYTAPFSLSASESISAYASVTASGTTATSATVTQAYVVVLPPATPVVSPGAGGYTSAQTVTITDGTSGASIFYAINGGAYVPYTAPFSLSASESISAYATLTSSGTTATSATVTQAYVIVLPPATPIISPAGGSFTSAQTVTISDSTSGANIFYTINGGAYVAYTGAITVSTSETISAYATLTVSGTTATSPVNTQSYSIGAATPPAVPVISPLGGSYTTVQTVTITDSTAGANIFYSINGGPFVAYTGPFSLYLSESIAAYASVTTGGVSVTSATNTQTYSVLLTPATPVVLLPPGTYTGPVSIAATESTPGAVIGYSINGATYVQYTGPIVLSTPGTYTVRILGYYSNGTQSKISAVVTGVYVIH